MRNIVIVFTLGLVLICACSNMPKEVSTEKVILPRQYPPIEDANPEIREKRVIRIPSRLTIEDNGESYKIETDTNSMIDYEIEVGHNMAVGFRHRNCIVTEQSEFCYKAGRSGGNYGNTIFSFSKPQIYAISNGIPFLIERRSIIFETSSPPQHKWMPGSFNYKVLDTIIVKSEIIE